MHSIATQLESEVRQTYALLTAHQQILAAIAPLSEEDLLKPYVYYQPDETRQENNAPIIHWISGDTFAHYGEHLDWIGALE